MVTRGLGAIHAMTGLKALNASRPVVIEAVVDPDVPPLPGASRSTRPPRYWKRSSKGDPDAAEIIRHSMRELAASV
jgi:pyruvate dehydrogenase (quinone)